MNKLNILNLSTTEQGGAGIAALYFNELFNRAGHNAMLVVKQSKCVSNNVTAARKTHRNYLGQLFNEVIKRLRKLNNKNHLFDTKYCFYNTDEGKEYVTTKEILDVIPFKPDVIVLHWVQYFINSKTINELAETTHAKVLWLMIDNAPLTGGCHYPWTCIGFHSDCSNCPAITDDAKKDIAQKNLAFKKDYLPEKLEVVACSELDFIRAKNASLFKNKISHKILLPIDENKFMPADKTLAKQYFGIDPIKKVIFYGSISFGNIRKGGRYFVESLSIFQNMLKKEGKALNELIIMVAGKGGKEYFNQIEIPVLHVGYLSEDNLIKAYQAADVFVSSSIEDSGPLMINQSIMCGTPVVSFEMGVALDLAITGQTGYLARLKDSEDLAQGIKATLNLDQSEQHKMQNSCRELGMKLCNYETQAKAYLQIFRPEFDTASQAKGS